jgi:hypothetical protein
MRLLRSVGIDERELQRPAGKERAMQGEIKRRLVSLTPRIGLGADEVLDMVGDISFYAAAIGFAGGELRARHPQVLEQLRPLAQAVHRWMALESGDSRELAEQIVDCANWTLREVSPLLIDCQRRLEDVVELVRSWRDDRGDVREHFALPDWLLDGWPEICAIWDNAAGDERSMQRGAVAQIHRLLPLAQTMAENGGVEVVTMDSSVIRSRSVKLHEDWKSGMVMNGMRARTEAIRAGVA